MATSTSTPIPPPVIPTGREIFDAIMGEIEPELTTEGAKTVAEKYNNETPEENYERRKRYSLAYDRYEKAYEETMATLHAQVNRYKRASYDQVEQEDRAGEMQIFTSLDKALTFKAV